MAELSASLLARTFARAVREPPASAVSPMDKLLGIVSSPASVESFSSGKIHERDAGELDEGDIWEIETAASTSLPAVEQRRPLTTPPLRVVADEKDGDSGKGGVDGELYSSAPRFQVGDRGVNGSPQDRNLKGLSGRKSIREGSRRIPIASRMIPRGAPSEDIPKRVFHQSAPVNIPDWSQILKMTSPNRGRKTVLDDDDKDDDEERLPPHEYLAREYARNQMYPLSVFEGAGRTLKGRDLSRVRNAILTHTGFLE